MEKDKIKICDVCEERIAIDKCFICGNDLCKQCKHPVQIGLADDSTFKGFSSITFCKKCAKNIKKTEVGDISAFDEQIGKPFKDYLLKSIVLDSLEDKEPEPPQTNSPWVVSGGSTWGPIAVSGSVFAFPSNAITIGSKALPGKYKGIIGTALTGANAGQSVTVRI